MKIFKKLLIFLVISACILGVSGCGEKDLRIFKKDISATVNGEEQTLYYAEWYREHEPGESLLTVDDGAYNIYFSEKDHAKTISGTSHDVTLTFAEVKPKFRVEDVRFMAIGRDAGNDPDNYFSYGDIPLEFAVTDFKSEKGKLSFHFEIDELFANDIIMFCIAIWYDYDYHNVFIPMYISAELVSDHPTVPPEDGLKNALRVRPNYID